MEGTIRTYTKADNKACVEAFKSNVPTFFTLQEILDFENFLIHIEKGDAKTHFYVVVVNNKVVGCGGFGDKDNRAVLSLAWGLVHKDYHKKGLGKLLLVHRLEQIKQLTPQLLLVVDTTQHSYGFFEKYGFVTTKVTNDFYAIGLHRYDMEFLPRPRL